MVLCLGHKTAAYMTKRLMHLYDVGQNYNRSFFTIYLRLLITIKVLSN